MNWENYDDVMQQLRAAGLLVEDLEVGRLRRCRVEGDREKRGWYSLHELRVDSGATLLVGSYGVWRGAEANAQKVELRRRALTSEQRQALKARIDADRKQAEQDRRRTAERAAARAQRAWDLCKPDGVSTYLQRKGVAAHGVRFTERGNMVIPLLDVHSRVHGLQVIYGAKKHDRDKDYWPSGMAKQGHFFLLGPVPAGVLLVAEGYATAASLFEATGYPVAVAFDANNLQPVAVALQRRYTKTRILVCADDDYLGRCSTCKKYTPTAQPACAHCGETHGKTNAGVTMASAAALAVRGAWIAPTFSADRPLDTKGPTDFNDLHRTEGLHVVRAQVEAHIRQLGWLQSPAAERQAMGGEGSDGDEMRPIESLGELLERFALVYELPDTVFDGWEHKLVPLSSMRNACISRMLHRQWMESRLKRIVRVREVGFDPAETDPAVKCNLWGGWPTKPREGECSTLLDLLHHLCSHEEKRDDLYRWVLRWLAYPLQHPGAKMQTALVLHGPQGTGKNLFFEAIMAIYGEYGRIVDQAAVEDKFNDWASRKLFLIADEVVARMELYHTKNKLKSLVTGDWIRINPKNLGAYDERNHVNLVFLSNEVMPIVLERDDRRYVVIWTPPVLSETFYEQVRQEIQSGGIAALHHYLLQLELGDFKPWTKPPMTAAKEELIELSLDSTERFWREWIDQDIPLPVVPARSEALYEAYRHWCHRNGVSKAAQLSTFIGNTTKRPGAQKQRRRYCDPPDSTSSRQATIIGPPKVSLAELGQQQLSEHLACFDDALNRWRDSRGANGYRGGDARGDAGGGAS